MPHGGQAAGPQLRGPQQALRTSPSLVTGWGLARARSPALRPSTAPDTWPSAPGPAVGGALARHRAGLQGPPREPKSE